MCLPLHDRYVKLFNPEHVTSHTYPCGSIVLKLTQRLQDGVVFTTLVNKDIKRCRLAHLY